MTNDEIRGLIAIVLDDVSFDETALLSYAENVRNDLRRGLPVDAKIDAFNRIKEFVVQIRLEGRLVEVITALP